jgi:O-methyltransferase
MVQDTIPDHAPDEIAILHFDTDYYESTRHEIFDLYPRLVPGGVLIIDDYGHFRGSVLAVDEIPGGVRRSLAVLHLGRAGSRFPRCEAVAPRRAPLVEGGRPRMSADAAVWS